MSRMDEFRKFVSTHGLIKNEVLSGKKTWQQIYEDWVILGESDKSFDIYRTADFKSDQENKSNTNTTSKQTKQFKLEDLFASDNIKTIINYVKKINPDTLSKTLNTIQKVLQITQGFTGGTSPNFYNANYNSWWD